MGFAVSVSVNLDWITCCACGTPFAMTTDLLGKRREDGKSFYCPNGHSQSFSTSELDRTKAKLVEAEKKLQTAIKEKEWAQTDAKYAQEAQKKAERKLKRVAKGTCPCCKRSFQNLQNHMASKHPEFTGEEPVVPPGATSSPQTPKVSVA